MTLKPDFAAAHFNLGNVLVKLDEWDEAEAAFRRSIELVPDDAEVHNNLGTLLELRLRLDEARACYDRAIELDANSAVRIAIGLCYGYSRGTMPRAGRNMSGAGAFPVTLRRPAHSRSGRVSRFPVRRSCC